MQGNWYFNVYKDLPQKNFPRSLSLWKYKRFNTYISGLQIVLEFEYKTILT